MSDIHDAFKAAGEEAAARIRAQREAKENPHKTHGDTAQAFAEHLEQQLNEQRANGMRLDTTNL